MSKKNNMSNTRAVQAAVTGIKNTLIKFGQEEERDVTVKPDENRKPEDTMETLKSIIGANDPDLAWQILNEGLFAIGTLRGESNGIKVLLQTIRDLQPKDVMETRLITQASALFSHGLVNLRRAETADMMCHSEYYTNKAVRLLRLHNETIDALGRYRRGGEQRVTVTHALITENAIVNNFGVVGGGTVKNDKGTPCPQRYAEQRPELTAINLAASQPWQTEDADCMEVKAVAQKQRQAEGE
jgi:hypothetical protein